MKRMLVLFLVLFLSGCAGGAYKLPKEEYRERVRILGVLPLMVDPLSTVSHPERDQIIAVLRRQNAGKEDKLIKMLREQKDYFDVREIEGDPQQLFSRLVRDATLRGSGDRTYRRYLFNGATASELASRNMVDGLLVLVLNGVERTEKRRDRGTSLAYLEAPYNSIQVTAAVVLPSGEIAWEYTGAPGEAFLPLQYPDFEEAYYNKTDQVRIKYITVAGLERALGEPSKGMFTRNKFPDLYLDTFEDITKGLNPGLVNPFKAKQAEGARQPQ